MWIDPEFDPRHVKMMADLEKAEAEARLAAKRPRVASAVVKASGNSHADLESIIRAASARPALKQAAAKPTRPAGAKPAGPAKAGKAEPSPAIQRHEASSDGFFARYDKWLDLLLDPEEYEHTAGDLEEMYRSRAKGDPGHAKWWLRRQLCVLAARKGLDALRAFVRARKGQTGTTSSKAKSQRKRNRN